MEIAGLTVEGVPPIFKVIMWVGSVGLIGCGGAIRYLYVKNDGLKKHQEEAVVKVITDSIDNLSETIKVTTGEFKETFREMWVHIGELQHVTDWLVGQHEINHDIPYNGVERRQKPRLNKGGNHVCKTKLTDGTLCDKEL